MMKAWLGIFLMTMIGVGASQTTPLTTVAHVDVQRYVGKWFEIARYPNRFEKECARDVTAEYALRSDGKLTVRNSCRRSDGKLKVSEGKAKIVDTQSNAKLKVTFFWPFYGDYWIVDLAPDYSYALVGEPERRYLWVLSRTPALPPDVYQRILARVRQLGYDPEKLMNTPQGHQTSP